VTNKTEPTVDEVIDRQNFYRKCSGTSRM